MSPAHHALERLTRNTEQVGQIPLRNLRAMRKLKANPVSINIRQAGQVNVAQQQVNVHEDETDPGVSQG